jgi:hypothetical protein
MPVKENLERVGYLLKGNKRASLDQQATPFDGNIESWELPDPERGGVGVVKSLQPTERTTDRERYKQNRKNQKGSEEFLENG